MAGKILVIVIALVAGAAGAYGYQLAAENLALFPQEEEDPRISELEAQLAAMTVKVQELSEEQRDGGPETEVLSARLDTLEERFAGLQEKQAKPEVAGSEAQAGLQQGNPGNETAGSQDNPATATTRRITGEELVTALKELPEEGQQMIRKAIHQEVQRIRKEHEARQDPRKKMEQEVGKVIRGLTRVLELTPVQIEQMRAIGARHIDKIVEVAKVAEERGDPEYAQKAKKEIETQTKREIVETITPEQLDKLREMDPEGIGKEYPRGF
jgi:uncharacterized coiled-coil protein SlyX